ncbi:MAG: alpha/beta hydrolase, partial [Mesorhizobium sp.]
LVPTLVIHAPDDREVSADHATRYAGAGDHVSLHWADGLGHRRILADKGVVEHAVRFATGHGESTLMH